MITKKANLAHVLKNLHLTRNEPVSLVHFITNRCNARCSFCFINFDDPKTFEGELNLKEIELLTKSMGKSLLNVNLTGGEPFARKEIVDIAKLYIDNTTIQSIYVTTNASLPDRIANFAEVITDYDKTIDLTFQISIDDFPKEHNKVRKVENLFENCIETYRKLKSMNDRVTPVVSVTVTHENCDNMENIFKYLTEDCKIDSLKCTIVRDEGVFKTPQEKREKIFNAYCWLTDKIKEYSKIKKLRNYNLKSIQGKLHSKKDEISWDLTKKMYLNPKYISPCHAGSLFGIITAAGLVYPCEILENKLLGNLRENNMNFMKIWDSTVTKEAKNFILKSKCNCTYECALTYNILGNLRYQPSLIKSFIDR